MKILHKYLLREIFGSFLVLLIACTTVLVTVRMLKLISLVMNKGVDPSVIIKILFSLMPPFLEIALPLSALFAVLLTFSRMSVDSELVVLRGSGVSLMQLLLPVLIFSSCSFVLLTFISQVGKPYANKALQEALFEVARSKTTAGLDAGIFAKLGALTLYAEEVEHETGALKKVLIDDKRTTERKLILSQRGTIVSNAADQSITFFLEDGSIHEFIDEKYILTHFKQNNLIASTDEILGTTNRKGQQVAEMLNSELERNIIELQQRRAAEDLTSDSRPISALEERTGWKLISIKEIEKRLNRLLIEETRRDYLPFSIVLLSFLGVPLGISSPRENRSFSTTVSVLLGLFSFGMFFSLTSIGSAMAESGSVSSEVAFISPLVFLCILAVSLNYLFFKEKISSLGQTLSSCVMRWKR